MSDFSKFRTSLSGFNRSDVANYIEALCADHRRQLKEKDAEREALLEQLNDVRSALEEKDDRNAALQAELEQVKTSLDENQKMLEEALSMEPAAPQEDYHSLELEAYRRAEAMERSTSERAARLQQQLTALVEETAGRYEQVGQDIDSLSKDLSTGLQRLQEALSELDAVFADTSDRFDTMDVTITEE